MKAFLKTVFATAEVTSTRTLGFLAWTGFIAIAMSLVLAVMLWMAFTPAARASLAADPQLRVAGFITLVAALMIAAQLAWTTSRGYVYCGRYDIIAQSRDPVIYWVYVTIHLLALAFFATFSFLTLQ